MSEMRQSFLVASPSKKRVWDETRGAAAQQKAPTADDDDDDIIDLTAPKVQPPPPPSAPTAKRAKSTANAMAAALAATNTEKPPPPPPTVAASPVPPPPISKAHLNDWPGIQALVAATGIKSVTTNDPGYANNAVMRLQFDGRVRITHAKVINTDELCRDYEAAHPEVRLDGGGSAEKRLFVWQKFMLEEMRPGGAFDSDMLLVEDQAHIFDPVVGRFEAVTLALFNASKPPIALTPTSSMVAGQLVTARSIKACYRPLFPKPDGTVLTEMEANAAAAAMGNAAEARGKEREENKRNAKKYGSLICSQKRLAELVVNLTERDRARIAKAHAHDLYDTLFMGAYFISTWLFYVYKARRDYKPGADTPPPVAAFAKAPQRARNKWQELIELCFDFGTPAANVEALMDTLKGTLNAEAQATAK